MFEHDDEEKLFDMENGFDANWFDKVDDEMAKNIINEGLCVKRIEQTDATWYTIYKYKKNSYVGLCDFADIWFIDEEDLEKII